MGKSTIGPDMLDCLGYLREIEKNTAHTVSILLEPDGFGDGPRWQGLIVAKPKTAPLGITLAGAAVAFRWPCNAHQELSACLYSSLARLDGELTRDGFFAATDYIPA